MKVRIYVMNKDTPSQYYGLKSAEDNRPLHAAPNHWKTYGGAYNWGTRHGYQVIRGVSDQVTEPELPSKPKNESEPAPECIPSISPVVFRNQPPFDLHAYLLGEIYNNMDSREKKYWNIYSASLLCNDLLLQGIVADTREVFETIREFIDQDKKERKKQAINPKEESPWEGKSKRSPK